MAIERCYGGEVLTRSYSKLTGYGKDNHSDMFCKKWGVSRLINKNGVLRFGFEAEGSAFITSPIEKIMVEGNELWGRSVHGTDFSVSLYEEDGIWKTPNGLATIGFHKGWLFPAKWNSEVSEVSIEICVTSNCNEKCNILLTINETTYILTPVKYEYYIESLLSEDGNYYNYYMMSITTSNNVYTIALKTC